METTGIAAYREKLEQVVGKYHDFLGDEAESLCQEHSVSTARDLQAQMASIEDEERLLKIGIVGRVKSGKSSLLNALVFDGQSILPEAATPMTASLTTLSHGEPLSAEVEFFTWEDLADIRDKAEEYDRQLERRVREIRNKEKKEKAYFLEGVGRKTRAGLEETRMNVCNAEPKERCARISYSRPPAINTKK